MYVDSVYAKHFQEVAKLSSPMTTVPMAGCLTFYYHRDQEKGNIFSVFTRDQLGHYDEIWRPEVYATAGWTQVSVDIKALHPLQVCTKAGMFNHSKQGSFIWGLDWHEWIHLKLSAVYYKLGLIFVALSVISISYDHSL